MEKLYLLQDGTYAQMGDVSAGKDGKLRTKNGVGVCYDSEGKPEEINKAAVDNMNVAAAKTGDNPYADKAPAPLMTTETFKAPDPALAPKKVV